MTMRTQMFLLIFILFVLAIRSQVVFSATCDGIGQYRNSGEVGGFLEKVALKSNGYASYKLVGKTYGTNGTDGKDIHAILISENANWGATNKPAVVITGAIHANEWATPEITIGVAEYLLENKLNAGAALDVNGTPIIGHKYKDPVNGDEKVIPQSASILELLKKIEVIIIPVINPEGYDHSSPTQKSSTNTWRPNYRKLTQDAEVCYDNNGIKFSTIPANKSKCYLGDCDDGTTIYSDCVMICESEDGTQILDVDDNDYSYMLDAVEYDSKKILCASGYKRTVKDSWIYPMDKNGAKNDGYLQPAYGVDLNRNFSTNWDNFQHTRETFVRLITPSSRVYRGPYPESEKEVQAMRDLVDDKNVVALIDYHTGGFQVLYPFASTPSNSNGIDANATRLRKRNWDKDKDVFPAISEKIKTLIKAPHFGPNYLTSRGTLLVGAGVARDWYYDEKNIAAINIEAVAQRITVKDYDDIKAHCKKNLPGAIWLMFWTADNYFSQPAKDFYREQKPAPKSTP